MSTAKEKKAGGRSTEYSEEVASIILARLSDGESARSIARDPAMPVISTIMKWLADNKQFSEQYARACEMRADAVFDELFEIADDGQNDWMERQDKDGENIGWQLNGEHVQRSKLRVDARKWALARMQPKKYGDRITHAGDPENPVVTKELTDHEYARRTAFVLQRAKREGPESAQGDDAQEDG